MTRSTPLTTSSLSSSVPGPCAAAAAGPRGAPASQSAASSPTRLTRRATASPPGAAVLCNVEAVTVAAARASCATLLSNRRLTLGARCRRTKSANTASENSAGAANAGGVGTGATTQQHAAAKPTRAPYQRAVIVQAEREISTATVAGYSLTVDTHAVTNGAFVWAEQPGFPVCTCRRHSVPSSTAWCRAAQPPPRGSSSQFPPPCLKCDFVQCSACHGLRAQVHGVFSAATAACTTATLGPLGTGRQKVNRLHQSIVQGARICYTSHCSS